MNKKSTKTSLTNPSFKAIINGKFYRDEIVKIAREALDNPDILKFYKKKSFLDTYKNWHNQGMFKSSIGERFAVALFTLGVSEITWTLAARLEDMGKNSEIEEIFNCMEDIKKASGF
jgi:hypothetical protein